MQLKLGRVV